MSQPTQKPSKVLETYRAMHARSAALYQRARGVIPGGVTHDGRHMTPFPVYIERALGPRKWDVDGHEYVDYWMGHGALILGHCHPAVVEAIQRQAALATHPGACHEAEMRWAELVCQLVPSAEMVRFTMSGTEATQGDLGGNQRRTRQRSAGGDNRRAEVNGPALRRPGNPQPGR